MTTLRHLSPGNEFMTAASKRFGKVRSIKGLKYGNGVRVILERSDGTTENRVLHPDTKVYLLPSLGSVVVRPEGFERKSERDAYEPTSHVLHVAVPGWHRGGVA